MKGSSSGDWVGKHSIGTRPAPFQAEGWNPPEPSLLVSRDVLLLEGRGRGLDRVGTWAQGLDVLTPLSEDPVWAPWSPSRNPL